MAGGEAGREAAKRRPGGVARLEAGERHRRGKRRRLGWRRSGERRPRQERHRRRGGWPATHHLRSGHAGQENGEVGGGGEAADVVAGRRLERGCRRVPSLAGGATLLGETLAACFRASGGRRRAGRGAG